MPSPSQGPRCLFQPKAFTLTVAFTTLPERRRPARWPLAAVLAGLLAASPAGAQVPTGQTSLSLRVQAGNVTDRINLTGTPAQPLAGARTAIERTGAPDSSYGNAQGAWARGSVSATQISLYSKAQATAHINAGYYGGTARANAEASASVPLRLVDPALTGTRGTLVANLHLTGDVAFDAGSYDPATGVESRGRAYVALWASGATPQACPATFGADRCIDATGDAQGVHVYDSGVIDTVQIRLPFRWGEWTNLSLQMWTAANVGVTAATGGGFIGRYGEVDHEHTLRWGGVQQVLDAAGNPVASGWAIESLPGLDLAAAAAAAAVPEPAGWALLASGAGLLPWLMRRRRAAAGPA